MGHNGSSMIIRCFSPLQERDDKYTISRKNKIIYMTVINSKLSLFSPFFFLMTFYGGRTLCLCVDIYLGARKLHYPLIIGIWCNNRYPGGKGEVLMKMHSIVSQPITSHPSLRCQVLIAGLCRLYFVRKMHLNSFRDTCWGCL